MNLMFAHDFLHFCECCVSSDWYFIPQICDRLGINLPLLSHLGAHLCNLVFFWPDSSILIIKHILQRLNRLVSRISHFFLLPLSNLWCLGSVLRDSILKQLILWQILITILPDFIPGDHWLLLLNLAVSLTEILLQDLDLFSDVTLNQRFGPPSRQLLLAGCFGHRDLRSINPTINTEVWGHTTGSIKFLGNLGWLKIVVRRAIITIPVVEVEELSGALVLSLPEALLYLDHLPLRFFCHLFQLVDWLLLAFK